MTDRRTVLTVVIGVAVLAFAGLIGIVVLALFERPIPDALGNVTVGGLTALGAILASTRSSPPSTIETTTTTSVGEDVPAP